MTIDQLVVDYAITVCKGCQEERTYNFDPFLRGADEIHKWIQSGQIKPCACGADTCDIKLHIVTAN